MNRDSVEDLLRPLRPLLDDDQKLSVQQKEALNSLMTHYQSVNSIPANDILSLNSIPQPFDRVSYRSDNTMNRDPVNGTIKWVTLFKVIILICLSSFIFGYVTIQASLIIDTSNPVSKGALNYNYIPSKFEKSLILSSSLIGASIGSFLMLFYPSVKYGRKRILLISNIPIFVGCIVTLIGANTVMVVTGLIFEGIGFGVSSVVVVILLGELSPGGIRCFVVAFHQLFIVLGMCMASVFTIAFSDVLYGWKYVTSFVIIVVILQIVFAYKIPNSPRWLIAIGQQQKAKHIMCMFVVDVHDAEIEYEQVYRYITQNLEKVARHDSVSDAPFKNICEYLRALLIGISMNIFQQITGCNVILYRSQNIFENQTIYSWNSIYISILIIYLGLLISTIIWVILLRLNNVKHKTIMYVGLICMFIGSLFLGIINISFHNNQTLIDKLSLSQIPFYIFGFGISLGGFVWIINSELFPFNNRIRYGSICIFTQWLS
eukprot:45176_1